MGITRPESVAERELVWPIVAHPQLLGEIEEEFAALELVEAELAALRDAIVGWYGEQGHLDPGGLKGHLCEIGFANLVGQLAARGSVWYGRDRDLGSVLEDLGETGRALAVFGEIDAEVRGYRDVSARLERLSRVQVRT